jgi:glutaredoxin 3
MRIQLTELFLLDDGSAIQSVLADLTGQSTVPNIFIAKQHIGGNSDLQAKKGSLQNLLKEAGAV